MSRYIGVDPGKKTAIAVYCSITKRIIDVFMRLLNKRPVRIGSYKVGGLIGKLLGRRGRFDE